MRRQIAKMPLHLTFTATYMLGSKLFSAPFKVGEVLKWPELLSGDMFLSQLQQEPVVTRHIPAAPEVDGMSWGCSSCSPVSSSNVLELYGKSLGSGVHDQARGSQKGLTVVVSVLPWFLIFYLGKDFPMPFFTSDIYITEVFLKASIWVTPSIEQSCELFSITDGCI